MMVPNRTTTPLAAGLPAPYAEPQTAAHARLPEHPDSRRSLEPFVPRDFRAGSNRDVTVWPLAEVSSWGAPITAVAVAESAEFPAAHIDASSIDPIAEFEVSSVAEDAFLPAADFDGASVESLGEYNAAAAEDVLEPRTGQSPDLPWIDAYAVDESDAEEDWPLGEAGKRLDELTESLSSLDASRARRDAAATGDRAISGETPEAPLPMWHDDEWIDIMPTAVAIPAAEELQHETAEVAGEEPFDAGAFESFGERRPDGAELTAQALESLAHRIRLGEVQVPDVAPQIAQEALLAGVLASMLGWRQ